MFLNTDRQNRFTSIVYNTMLKHLYKNHYANRT